MRARRRFRADRPWLAALLFSAAVGAVTGCRHRAVNHEAAVTHSAAHASASAVTAPRAPERDDAPPPTVLALPPSASQPGASPVAAETAAAHPLGAKSADEPAPHRAACRVAAVGDSLTDYRSGGGGYLRLLESRLPASRFDNHGVGGQMVNQMRQRFQQILQGARYTHVIIFGGVNDLYSDQTANRTNPRIQSDLSQMYSWARDAGATVIAVTVAPWGGFRKYFRPHRGENTLQLNAWMFEQQRSGLVDHVVDAHRLLRCGAPHELCPEHRAPFDDGLHFGPSGHELLGSALLKVLDDCR